MLIKIKAQRVTHCGRKGLHERFLVGWGGGGWRANAVWNPSCHGVEAKNHAQVHEWKGTVEDNGLRNGAARTIASVSSISMDRTRKSCPFQRLMGDAEGTA